MDIHITLGEVNHVFKAIFRAKVFQMYYSVIYSEV